MKVAVQGPDFWPTPYTYIQAKQETSGSAASHRSENIKTKVMITLTA
jgi:hypothetical protein